MQQTFRIWPFVALALVAWPATGIRAAEPTAQRAGIAPADRLAETIEDPQLRALIRETLDRNPELRSRLAEARATAGRALEAKGLPDPILATTAWVQGPETRTGPQVLTLSWTQPLPWLGKLDSEAEAGRLEAQAQLAEAEALRLELVTGVRRLYYELAFLARQRAVAEDFLDHLLKHETLSRSRYSTGIGSSQDVLKIQAEITMAEMLILDIGKRRVEVEQKINRLRDRPASVVILPPALPVAESVALDYDALVTRSRMRRPEIAAAEDRIAANQARQKRAEKQAKPDFGVGLTYTFVDRREDVAGELLPPEGNGDDIIGFRGAISIPLWRDKNSAALLAAEAHETAVRERRRSIEASIESALGDLVQRIPLTWQQLRLLQDILIQQAKEGLRSAQSSYISGNLNALDLLDAEHVLFDTETSIARARADYAIQLAELEGVVGEAVQSSAIPGGSTP